MFNKYHSRIFLNIYTGMWKVCVHVCVCVCVCVICFHFKGWDHTLHIILKHAFRTFTCILDVFPHDCVQMALTVQSWMDKGMEGPKFSSVSTNAAASIGRNAPCLCASKSPGLIPPTQLSFLQIRPNVLTSVHVHQLSINCLHATAEKPGVCWYFTAWRVQSRLSKWQEWQGQSRGDRWLQQAVSRLRELESPLLPISQEQRAGRVAASPDLHHQDGPRPRCRIQSQLGNQWGQVGHAQRTTWAILAERLTWDWPWAWDWRI